MDKIKEFGLATKVDGEWDWDARRENVTIASGYVQYAALVWAAAALAV